jgi:branched-subunit amino acid aminotransferase/4-amino-4-deoxychorismate lyase
LEISGCDRNNYGENSVTKEPLVYLNHSFVPAAQAQLAIWDAGVVQGATVTEMTRTFHKQPFRLGDHLDRLFRALDRTRMNIGLSKHELTAISHELLAHNGGLVDASAELGLVHFVTAGEYATYAIGRPPRTAPTVCVHTFPLPFFRWADKLRKGTRLITPSIRQVPPQCWDPGMKCRSRMHYYLADQEVHLTDPDASALLLDLDGNVTETSTGNFLMVEDGVLSSPTLENTLPGISRATVIELAGELGIRFTERDIAVSEALSADEALLSSTSYCLMPVTKINDTTISEGQPGPVYHRLLAAWSQRVGLDIERQIVTGGQ